MLSTIRPRPSTTLFPYTTLFRSFYTQGQALAAIDFNTLGLLLGMMMLMAMFRNTGAVEALAILAMQKAGGDRKSTRLNSSHTVSSYAVFCLKKKNDIPSRLVRKP